MFDKYGEMFGGIEASGLLIIGAICVATLLFFLIRRLFSHAKVKESLEVYEATQKYEAKKVEEAKEKGKERATSILGTGNYKCICYRPGQIEDWTTIPYPIGELYMAEPGCPWSGGVYIVRETPEGNIVDYDPREVPLIPKETPEWAWYATHWPIVKRVFSLPLNWWKSTSTWFAIAMVATVFISMLVLLGGG